MSRDPLTVLWEIDERQDIPERRFVQLYGKRVLGKLLGLSWIQLDPGSRGTVVNVSEWGREVLNLASD